MSARYVPPLDPDSPAGHQATEALSQVLAEILVEIWQRQAADPDRAQHTRDAA